MPASDLSRSAADLLARLDAEVWRDVDDDDAWVLRDLAIDGLVETQLWPPPPPPRHRRAHRAIPFDESRRRTQARLTPRGRRRLERVRAGGGVKPALVIYHDHCTDGWTAAWVAHRYFEKSCRSCELLAASYGDTPPKVDGRDVVIVDFSYSRDVLVKMRERARSLLVLDHHRTAEEALRGLPFVTFDMSRSGAGLAWDRFFPFEARPWIVDYVEDRDLWRWVLPGSQAVSAYLRTVLFDLEAWTRLSKEPVGDVVARGRAVLAHIDMIVRGNVGRASIGSLGGHDVPVVNASGAISETGNTLASKAPFAAVWFVDERGRYQYSLRSSRENPDHLDVSEIAKRFGGGGHRHAAGFISDVLVHRVAS